MFVLISSKDDTYPNVNATNDMNNKTHTIYLQAILKRSDAAGHSGQKTTVRRSDIKLSKIDRCSASFEFFVVLDLPDLRSVEYKDIDVYHDLPLSQEDDNSLRSLCCGIQSRCIEVDLLRGD